MQDLVGSVKCLLCGHVSGHLATVGGDSTRRRFTPRPGYDGALPRLGAPLRCERCAGPVYLEGITRVGRLGISATAVKRVRRLEGDLSA